MSGKTVRSSNVCEPPPPVMLREQLVRVTATSVPSEQSPRIYINKKIEK